MVINMGILSGTVRRLTRVAKNKNVMKTLKTAMNVTGASSIPLFQSGFNKFAGLGDRPQSEVAPTNTAPTQEVQGSPQPQVGRTQQNQAQTANRQSQAEQTQAVNRQAEQALVERANATRQEALLNEVRLIRTGVDLLVENQSNTRPAPEAKGGILEKLGGMISTVVSTVATVGGLAATGGGLLRSGAGRIAGGVRTLATRGMGLFRAAPAVTAGAGALTQAAGAIPPSVVAQGAGSVAGAAGTSGARVAGRAGLKGLGKSILKKIPVVGLLAGVGFGLARAAKGDFTGAALELASGAAGTIPGIGTAASVGLDAALIARDVGKSGETEGQVPTPQDIQTSEVKPTLEAITQAGTVEATKDQIDTKGVITKSNQLTEGNQNNTENNKSITSLNDTSDINKSIVTLASTTENLDKDIVNTNQYSLSPSDIKNSSIETQLASTIANQQGNVMNSMVQGDRNLTHTSSQNMMQGAINTNVDGDRAYNEIISKTQRETDNKTIVIQAPQQQQAPVIQRIPEVGAGTAGMQAPVHTGASDSAITTITRLFMSKGIPA